MEKSREVYLLCSWESYLAGFPHLKVADKTPATSRQVRYITVNTVATSQKSRKNFQAAMQSTSVGDPA